ncbi:MAG: pitrilysin family protein [Candidatus Portnoybacteria bacterium]|nr:pitrilysin family protein [Candidatus Portnoybacteria bacterium]
MFQKQTLPNGLRIINAPMEGAKSLTVLVLIGTGSKYEIKENNGISHFLEHIFFKGTQKRPTTLEITSDLDMVGGAYNAFTSKEFTGFWAKVDPEHGNLVLDWVSDILLNSKFDAAEIEREKGVIIEEINMYQDTPMQNVWYIWEELLYGDQPAGWLTLGTKEIIRTMKREQFLKYLSDQYVAKNTIIVIAGATDKIGDAKNVVGKYFEKIKKGNFKKKLKVVEKQKKPNLRLGFKETDQSHLVLGFRSYDIFHKDAYAVSLLATILGGFMSSRLFMEVREKRGLCYYIRSANETYTDSGYLVANAGVDNVRIEEAIKVILGEFQKVRDEKIPEAEIKKAKDHIKGATILSLESSDEMASFLGSQEVLKKRLLTPEQFFVKINKVTAEDLQRVAREIFKPKNLNLAVIGPFKEEERFKKLLRI